jgi:hypothetical protein
VVINWGILVQSTHHQRGEGDAGGDLQGVGGDGLAERDDQVTHQIPRPRAQAGQQGPT